MSIYIWIYIHICMDIYIYIYICGRGMNCFGPGAKENKYIKNDPGGP